MVWCGVPWPVTIDFFNFIRWKWNHLPTIFSIVFNASLIPSSQWAFCFFVKKNPKWLFPFLLPDGTSEVLTFRMLKLWGRQCYPLEWQSWTRREFCLHNWTEIRQDHRACLIWTIASTVAVPTTCTRTPTPPRPAKLAILTLPWIRWPGRKRRTGSCRRLTIRPTWIRPTTSTRTPSPAPTAASPITLTQETPGNKALFFYFMLWKPMRWIVSSFYASQIFPDNFTTPLIVVMMKQIFRLFYLFNNNWKSNLSCFSVMGRLNTTGDTTVSMQEDSDEQQEVIEVQILPQVRNRETFGIKSGYGKWKKSLLGSAQKGSSF